MFYFIIVIIICIALFAVFVLLDKRIEQDCKKRPRNVKRKLSPVKEIIPEQKQQTATEPSVVVQKKEPNPKNVREELCRQIAEDLFGKKFPSVRPNFLKSTKTGRNLELDGYCEELGIAFEHNGIQHYKYPNIFHKTEEEFMRGLANDKFKKDTCKINGILLIIIPYTVPKCQIRQYMIDQVKDQNIIH